MLENWGVVPPFRPIFSLGGWTAFFFFLGTISKENHFKQVIGKNFLPSLPDSFRWTTLCLPAEVNTFAGSQVCPSKQSCRNMTCSLLIFPVPSCPVLLCCLWAWRGWNQHKTCTWIVWIWAKGSLGTTWLSSCIAIQQFIFHLRWSVTKFRHLWHDYKMYRRFIFPSSFHEDLRSFGNSNSRLPKLDR